MRGLRVTYSTEQTYVIVANPKTNMTHLAHALERDRSAMCRHDRHKTPLLFILECGGFRDPDEVEWGEATDGNIVTCKRCRRAARETILRDIRFARQEEAKKHRREIEHLDALQAFIGSALGATR